MASDQPAPRRRLSSSLEQLAGSVRADVRSSSGADANIRSSLNPTGARKMDRESLVTLLEQGVSVEKIAKRFGKDPSTVSYWMGKYDLVAPNRDKHAAKGGITQERLSELIETGATSEEIAVALGLSRSTVRYWLKRYGLRTHYAAGRRPSETSRAAKQVGALEVIMECARHGQTGFWLEGRGYYRCKRCRSEAVARRRRKVKAILVAEAGGSCVLCGYDRHLGAPEFHHLDPATKRVEINAKGVALALATLREEASKCVLLCANCHAEVEGGVAAVSLESGCAPVVE